MKLIKSGRKIVGWIEQQKDGSWGYAFGKPSQPSFIMFYTDTEDKAVSRVLDSERMFGNLVQSLKRSKV